MISDDRQLAAMLELERAERITTEPAPGAPTAPAHRSGGDTIRAGVPFRSRQALAVRLRRREGREPSDKQIDT